MLATDARIHDTILDAIGDTPLVRLSSIGAGLRPQLLAKVEYLNPGGSIKDRAAMALIEAAEASGALLPGGTIVEPTSGNTGSGLAIAARLKGYRMIAVMPDKVAREKIDLLRAYGAEVVMTPAKAVRGSGESYYEVADRLADEIPGAHQPNQYANQANPDAHYRSTGPELWEQTSGRITHLVAGVGTGGTITGAGRYLKERNPDIQVIGVDPVGSIYTGEPKPYLVEGVGKESWPETLDPSVIDRWVTVGDREAMLTTRRLALEEGLLTGGSCGMALFGALEVARGIEDPGCDGCRHLPDGGRSYLSKVFNDAWMTAVRLPRADGAATGGDVAALQAGDDGEVPPLVTVRSGDEVARARWRADEHRVSHSGGQRPRPQAVSARSPSAACLKHAMSDPALLRAEVATSMEPPFPAVPANGSGGGGRRPARRERAPRCSSPWTGVPPAF
jgi:cystathionine beta-synthase